MKLSIRSRLTGGQRTARWSQAAWAALGVCLLAVLPSRAFIGISPAVIELRLAPGRNYRGTLWLSNPSDQTVRVGLSVTESWSEKVKGQGLPLSEWFRWKNPRPITIGPNGRRRIRFAVRLPRDFSGEAMAMLFFQSLEKAEALGPLALQVRQGIPVYVTALGTERPSLALARPAIFLRPPADGKTAMGLSLTVTNRGNVHLRPRGEVRIESPAGSLETGELQYGVPVFPGREQSYAAEFRREEWPVGRYRARVRVTPGDLFPGPAEEIGVVFEIKDGRIVPINDSMGEEP